MMSNKRAWKFLYELYTEPGTDSQVDIQGLKLSGLCLALEAMVGQKITLKTHDKMLTELNSKKPRRPLTPGGHWWTLSCQGRRARAKVCKALSK